MPTADDKTLGLMGVMQVSPREGIAEHHALHTTRLDQTGERIALMWGAENDLAPGVVFRYQPRRTFFHCDALILILSRSRSFHILPDSVSGVV